MIQTLINIRNSLNQVDVKGKPNLSIILGCMEALEQLINDIAEEEKAEATDEVS